MGWKILGNTPSEKQISIKGIPEEVLLRLDRQAAKRGQSRAQYIRDVLANVTESPEEADRIDREEKMFENIATVLEAFIAKSHELEEIIKDNSNDMKKDWILWKPKTYL